MILLETLPGWPAAEPMSGLAFWLLLVLGPLALGAIITVVVLAKDWARKK